MEPCIVAHIVCSSLSLACICVQSLFLVRFAIRLENADRKDPSGMELPRPPTKERRAKQILPAITAASGLAYCCCNLILRGRGSQHAEYVTRILLAFVVIFSESSTIADLAYLHWPTKAWMPDCLQCGVVVTGIASVTLRSLARQPEELDWLALWVPPTLSTIVDVFLLIMQINLVRTADRTLTGRTADRTLMGNVSRVVAIAGRQLSLLPYWAWCILRHRPMGMLALQHVQILLGIHDPRYWPGPIWKRWKHRKAAGSQRNNHERARQDFPNPRAGEGESMQDLVSSPHHEAESESAEFERTSGLSVNHCCAEVEVESSGRIS